MPLWEHPQVYVNRYYASTYRWPKCWLSSSLIHQHAFDCFDKLYGLCTVREFLRRLILHNLWSHFCGHPWDCFAAGNYRGYVCHYAIEDKSSLLTLNSQNHMAS